MFGAPRLLDLGLTCGPCAKRFAALGEGFEALGEDGERIVRIAAEILDRRVEIGAGRRERLPVGRNLVFEALSGGTFSALAHDRAADDKRRTLRLRVRGNERLADFVDVVSVH